MMLNASMILRFIHVWTNRAVAETSNETDLGVHKVF